MGRNVTDSEIPVELLLIEDGEGSYQFLQSELNRQREVNVALTPSLSFSEALGLLELRPFHGVVVIAREGRARESIRNLARSRPDLPVIVMGEDDAKALRESFRSGAHEFVAMGENAGAGLARAIICAIERKKFGSWAGRLRQSENNTRSIIEASVDAILIVDRAGRVRFLNPAAETLFDRSREDLLGEPFGFPVSTQQRTEIDVVRKDGSVCTAEMRNAELVWHGEAMMLSLLRDVTVQRRAQEAIRNANAELEQRVKERTESLATANRDLEAFSYSVSHDLMAPLRHISGFVEVLLSHLAPLLDAESTHLFNNVVVSVERMRALTTGLMEFSRLGRRGLSVRRFRVDELLKGVIEEVSQDLEGRRVEWRISDLPEIEGDASLIRLVLVNLVSNAAKFSRQRDPARIEIGTAASAFGQAIFVRDNGAGFDMKYADKLFNVFSRLHSETEFKGIGIGLATAQRIIAKHGGRIWAEATPGRGAAFYFTVSGWSDEGRHEVASSGR